MVGGHAVWSRGTEGGIYRAPLTGGRPALIPGTERLHLLQWPWAAVSTRLLGGRPGFRELVNVETGEKRDAPPGTGPCSLSWCLTRDSARPRLGGPERALPAASISQAGPALDRFLVLLELIPPADKRLFLHDLKSGRTGDLGIRFQAKVDDSTASDYMNAVILYPTTRYVLTYDLGGKRMVINLPAIR